VIDNWKTIQLEWIFVVDSAVSAHKFAGFAHLDAHQYFQAAQTFWTH